MKANKYLRTALGVALGNAILAFGINAFYLPNSLAVGGATGVGVLLYQVFGIDASVTVFFINVALLVLGWITVGKEFVISSIFGSLIYPLFLKLFQYLPSVESLVEDRLTGAICAGLLMGAGVGLTVRVGSSTGGNDTIAVICNHLFHTPIFAVKLMADYGVMMLIFLVVSPKSIVYSFLALAVETIVMNRVMLLGRSQLQLLIMTGKYQEIREMLLRELETGVTMLQAETGLRKTACQVILCVIPNKKLYAVKERVQDLDPNAFVTVAEVKEVRGQGFSSERIPQAVPSVEDISG